MSNWNDCITFLNENTSKKGWWSISCDVHKNDYTTFVKANTLHMNDDEVDDFVRTIKSSDLIYDDENVPVFQLDWCKESPVGQYVVFFNTVEQLSEILRKVK